jgi:hypothetical protein
MKRPGGKLRPLQHYWKDRLEAQGAGYYVIDNFDGIEAVMRAVIEESVVMPFEVHTP